MTRSTFEGPPLPTDLREGSVPPPQDPPGAASDASLRAAFIGVAASAAALTVGAFALFSSSTGAGVALGGALATANLWVMSRVARAFIVQRGTAPWAVVAGLKLLFLIGGVWWVLQSELVPGMALFAGYVALPLGITLGTLFGPRPAEG